MPIVKSYDCDFPDCHSDATWYCETCERGFCTNHACIGHKPFKLECYTCTSELEPIALYDLDDIEERQREKP